MTGSSSTTFAEQFATTGGEDNATNRSMGLFRIILFQASLGHSQKEDGYSVEP